MLPRILATRYVTPLREGGSLPGIVEADDLGTYVVKFRGAGQGLRVLVAEVVVAELGRRLGLNMPDLRAIELEPPIAKYEADEEVQDLLTASVGLNLAVDYLPGAFGYDAGCTIDPQTAASILWLDAFCANVDRTWRNPNLLVWHGNVWCIDHGAALYFHHSWSAGIGGPERFARQPYDATHHVLAALKPDVPAADARLAPQVTAALVRDVLDAVPDEWLEPAPGAASPDEVRDAYVAYLVARCSGSRPWLPGDVAA